MRKAKTQQNTQASQKIWVTYLLTNHSSRLIMEAGLQGAFSIQ